MTSTNIKACAKINLGLNIVSRRPDGYHNLETVFYPVPIYDDITIEPLSDSQPTTLTIVSPSVDEGSCTPPLPVDDNLVMKAYRLVAEHYTLPPVNITLVKRIPMQAGMGGGSADCSFTIRLLNEMFNLNMETAEMEAFALKLGADCPFFVRATPAYAEGIGEQLYPVQLDLSRYALAIVKPPVAVSTREAFANIKPKQPIVNCREIVRRPIDEWRDQLCNDFEDSIFPQYPVIREGKEQLYRLGARYAAMSGSGSALFAFFDQDCLPDLHHAFPQNWFKQLIINT